MSLVRESVLADHGYLPAITHALVRDDDRAAKRSAADQAVVKKSADFESYEPKATISRGDLWERTRDVLARETNARPPAGATARFASDPEGWAPPSSEVVARNGFVDENGEPETAHTVTMWLQWNATAERRPEDFPNDWVLEAELNTYSNNDPHLNPGGLWQRPLCLYDSNENFFWTGSNPNFSIDLNGNFLAWSIATLDQTLVPDVYGAYLDHNLHSDPCDRKSIGVGIAYPQDAPLLLPGHSESRGFITTVYMPRGLQESNKIASGYQLVSNDCEDTVHTGCVGLNVLREPPNGFTQGSLIANRSREFTAPGCHYYYSESMSAPEEYACGAG